MLELEPFVVQQGLLALRVGPTGMERWEPAGIEAVCRERYSLLDMGFLGYAFCRHARHASIARSDRQFLQM